MIPAKWRVTNSSWRGVACMEGSWRAMTGRRACTVTQGVISSSMPLGAATMTERVRTSLCKLEISSEMDGALLLAAGGEEMICRRVTARIGGMATLMILSACSASWVSGKLETVARAICMVGGRHCKNSSWSSALLKVVQWFARRAKQIVSHIRQVPERSSWFLFPFPTRSVFDALAFCRRPQFMQQQMYTAS